MSGTVNLVELREGGSQDLASVSTIMMDAFDARYGEAWTSAQCLGMLSLPGVWLVMASIDGRDAGFALSRIIADEAELLLLATRPAARRRGVAGALLRAVIEEARGRGVTRVHLEVRSGNDAVWLYRREGFEKVGERREYYRGRSGQLFDAHTYARDLD
ncbi:GNAT family N-acetyltransferase [Sphingomonas sp. R-74633]|uniref:GNAT family N-acetyltransferase n=1 Tax=Sphingomonas sp. R-74633 TaxID=2751188 RepID=UPI0015D35670|nr:GNAT family N-acetyltransferase [Sphingomonas sp. R-74633]NYT40860.1 GNAT family N-acetyltransferase [Sphingomonas sp. R-74633]